MLSHEDEVQVTGAFANVGLIASKVWAHDREDKYRKLNQSLWLQNCKLSETYNNGKSGKRTTVRDVIPESRLALYGNYEYSPERERLYDIDASDCGGRTHENSRIDKDNWYKDRDNDGARVEPWMLKQVDECFLRLTSPNANAFFSFSKCRQYLDDECGKYMGFPWAIDDDRDDELQLRARICSKVVKDLWTHGRHRTDCRTRSSMTHFHEPRIFDTITTVAQDEKNSKIRRYCVEKRSEIVRKSCHQQTNSYAIRNNERNIGVIDKRPSLLCPTVVTMSASITSNRPTIVPAILCPEVAEFFPKGPIVNVIGTEERQVASPVQFFPSSAEPSYKEELFPYDQRHFSTTSTTFAHNASGLALATVSHPATMNTWIGPNQWIQRITPPVQIQVTTVTNNSNNNQGPTMYSSSIQPFCAPTMAVHQYHPHHHPVCGNDRKIVPSPAVPITGGPNDTGPIPVYQRPAELYQDHSQRRGNAKSGQGVDYKNLILLTKSAMKARRNQSRNPRRATSFILESRQPNLKSESDVLRWLNKGYPKRAREFVTVNSLVTELTRFGGKCDLARATMKKKNAIVNEEANGMTSSVAANDTTNDEAVDATAEFSLDFEDDSSLSVAITGKKRLYRDVLTNGGLSTSDILVDDNILDKRYDELEKQAMEQYRTSEECLAMRYQPMMSQLVERSERLLLWETVQELERQGLEQYRHGDGSSESIRAVCSATLRSGKRVVVVSTHDDGIRNDSHGHTAPTCSGKSCDVDDRIAREVRSHGADKAGAAMERPVAILRSHIECASLIHNFRPRESIPAQSTDESNPSTNSIAKSFAVLSKDKNQDRGGKSLPFLRINLP